TFATQAARSDGSLRSTNSAAIGGIADMPGSSQAARYDATDPTRTLERLTHSITSSVRIKRHRHFDARYGAPSDVLVLSRSVFSMRDRMEAISATARIHHTSCRRCPYWTADGYRSDTQGLPPRYADRGSADGSRERGCRGAHRRADAARLHARSKPDIRSPWCGGQIEPNAATNAGTEDSQCRCRGDSQLSGSGHRQIIGHSHGHCDRVG